MLAKPTSAGGFGCMVAVNLDGGPSTGLLFDRTMNRASYPPLVLISYGIALFGQ